MAAGKFLKCDCAVCGGHIEFPADGIGSTISCPHCGSDTELILPAPELASSGTTRNLKWAIAGLIILALGVVGMAVAFNMARNLSREPRAAAAVRQSDSKAESGWLAHTNHFASSGVKIETPARGTLTYASGIVRNQLDAQRFGVTVELDLFNAAGAKVGTARDYRDTLDARGDWSFRALLVNENVASARVAAIREQP